MKNLLIACLCAEWCGTCREYRAAFDGVAREFPRHRFVWLDVEDQGDLVADVEIEDFPTLLVADGANLLFAGTLLPHAAHLKRLLLSLESAPARTPVPGHDGLAAFSSLAARLAADS